MFQTQLYQQYIKPARILLLVLVGSFVFYKLFVAYKFDELYLNYHKEVELGSWFYPIIALLLMLLNWGLEAGKWRFIINKYEKLSYGVALKAVLSGVTLSIITPNQIGDFAGRVLHLQVLDKIKGSLATVIGHTAQVLVTCVFGGYALLFFSERYFPSTFLVWILLFAVVLLVIGFLFMGVLYRKFTWSKIPDKIKKHLDVFGDYAPQELAYIFSLSMLRYSVYLIQYFLLLHFYKVEMEPAQAFACIIGTFLGQSIIPSFLLLEIGLRGASALWFFTMYSNNVNGILLSAYSLWIVNMLLPALFGLYYIYKVK